MADGTGGLSQTISGRPEERYQDHARNTPPGMGGMDPLDVALPLRDPALLDSAAAALLRAFEDSLTKYIPVPGASGVIPAGGQLALDLGGPALGYIWHVRSIQVGPVDYTAQTLPIAGFTVIAYARAGTNAAGIGGDRSAQSALSWTQQYPAQAFFSRGEAVCSQGDRLQVVVVGTVGATVTAGATVEQTAADVHERRSLG
jgi:hypothetical protein